LKVIPQYNILDSRIVHCLLLVVASFQ